MAREFDVELSGYFPDASAIERQLEWAQPGTRGRPARGTELFWFFQRAMSSNREMVIVVEGDAAVAAMERIRALLQKPLGAEKTSRRTQMWAASRRGEAVSWKPGLVNAVLSRSPSGKGSRIHGEMHWASVAAAGLDLLESVPGADPAVVLLFSVFHDACRESDGYDPEHGARGAQLAREMRDEGDLDLDDERLELLEEACRYHDKGGTSSDPTIGCCFDADRLNLTRVGRRPDARLLSTRAAREAAADPRPPEYARLAFDWHGLFRSFKAASLALSTGREQVYLRFGDLPPGASRVPLGLGFERGVSAYPGRKTEKGYEIDLSMLVFGIESRFLRAILLEVRPLYAVLGRRVGFGNIGEPVLAEATISEEVDPASLEVVPRWEFVDAAVRVWRARREGNTPSRADEFAAVRSGLSGMPGEAPVVPSAPLVDGIKKTWRETLESFGVLEDYDRMQAQARRAKPPPDPLVRIQSANYWEESFWR